MEQTNLARQLELENGGLWNRDVDDLKWWQDFPEKRSAVMQSLQVFWCPSEAGRMESEVYLPIVAATSCYAFSNGSLGPDHAVHTTKYKNNGAFFYHGQVRLSDVRDGLSNTYFVGEVLRPDTYESSNVWSYAIANADCLRTTTNPLNTLPGDGIVVERRNGAFGSNHPGGANFVYGDGHVVFVGDEIELETYRSLSTIADGEVAF